MRMKITVPNSLSEIKLSQYQKFLQIQKDNEDEHFLASKMIEIFCGIPHKESYTLKAKDVHRITNILADMFEQKPQLKRRFVLNGVEYGFIPNLDDMTLGEYVDLDTYISKWEEVEKAMAVLYRPIVERNGKYYTIKRYDGSEVRMRAEKFKKMKAVDVNSCLVFFWTLGNELSTILPLYLMERMKELKQSAQMKSSPKSGDGSE